MSTVIILGGGPASSLRSPLPFVLSRIQLAASIYHSTPSSKLICTSAGTAHVPQITCPTPTGPRPIYEASSCAAVLLSLGVPAESIYTEITSYDTIGNLYFALINFILLSPNTFPSDIVAITSSFHMPRAKMITDWVFNLQGLPPYKLTYKEVGDDGLSSATVVERIKKERGSMEYLETVIPTVTSVDGMFQWLTQTHTLYSAQGLVQRSECDETFEPFVRGDSLPSYGVGEGGEGSGDGAYKINGGWAVLLLVGGYLAGR